MAEIPKEDQTKVSNPNDLKKIGSLPSLDSVASGPSNPAIVNVPNEVSDSAVVMDPGDPSPESMESTKTETRDVWDNKWEFLLSCVGLSVGIGNVWRFPYLAYEHGGGSFLIAYLVMLTLAGRPMYFMELCLGQFGAKAALSIWTMSPICKGVGAAMVSVSSVVCIYYVVVMAWSLRYMFASFSSVLPWTVCEPSWDGCYVRTANASYNPGDKTSSQLYWEKSVLDLSDRIEDLGGIKWDLAACLLLCWVIVILCLIKGVKTSGKAIYFLAIFPYFVLFALLWAGLSQKGAWEGIRFFIVPDIGKLLSIKVWAAAASQMFFSLSCAEGALIMYSSYNDFRHDVYRDAMIVSVLDTATSLIAGLSIFSTLGAMSVELGISVTEVVQSGPGLAFVAYPEALALLPSPQIWSAMFFFMLFTLGLDFQFACLESIITGVSDEIPYVRKHKFKFTVAVGTVFFFIGLICCTRAGEYYFQIFDEYGATIPLVFIGSCETFGLMWVYGYDKFAFDVHFMLHRNLGWYWKVTWKYTAPCVLGFIAVVNILDYKPLKEGNYDFPDWADGIGWCITTGILIQIPAWALYRVFKQSSDKTFRQKVVAASQELPEWGPMNPEIKAKWAKRKARIFRPNPTPK